MFQVELVVHVHDVNFDTCCWVLTVVVTLFCVDVTMIPDNNIGDEGVKALVPALKSLHQLMSLNLGCEY